MVQVLSQLPPKGPSFLQSLLGGAVSGIQPALEKYQGLQKEAQQKQALKSKFGEEIANLPPEMQKIYAQELFKNEFAPKGHKPLTELQQSQKALADERLKALQGQQKLFGQLTGEDQEASPMGQEEGFEGQEAPLSKKGWSSVPDDLLDQVAMFAGQEGAPGILGSGAKAEKDKRQRENQERNSKEKQYFKFNEPKLAELANSERKTNLENARYNRMEELFSDPSKFPSSLMAAVFSKEGQINDLAYSQLSPEAQEFVKLIVDSTSGIKDTYGSRVTNFDLQTYLKKLPSLLMSQEGRNRVLRDLKTINNINQLYNKGIQEIFEEAGGSDKIPFSKAETLFKKKYGYELDKMLSDFVTPEKKSFSEMPNPKQYLGRKIKNPETGEIFISDGENWTPFKG